jgi:hypothetical protein
MVLTQPDVEHDAPASQGQAEALFKEARRRERRRRVITATAALASLSLIAAVTVLVVGSDSGSGTGGGSGSPSRPASAGTGRLLYQVDDTVIQTPGKPAKLCGIVATSAPPQCGGPTITNWRWGTVRGSTTMNGVTWGTYHLVGAYADHRFTLTQPVTAAHPHAAAPYHAPPPGCPRPPGGWPTASGTVDLYQQLVNAAQAAPDFAGMWWTPYGQNTTVYTVAYTGNVAAHRAQLQAIWPGALCVVERPRSLAKLHAIQQVLAKNPGGLDLLSSYVDEAHDGVDAEVVLVLPSDQSALDRRFGRGAVRLTSQLQPLQ